MANAAPQIMVDGNKDPTGFEHISYDFTLGIWTDTAITASDGYYCALVFDTTFGTIDYTTGFASPPSDPGISLEHSMSASDAGFPLPAGEDGIMGSIFPMVIHPRVAGTTIFDGIDFHDIWPFPMMLKLYVTNDFETSTLVDTAFVIAPVEPMTIGLLGFGALFLRRRK